MRDIQHGTLYSYIHTISSYSYRLHILTVIKRKLDCHQRQHPEVSNSSGLFWHCSSIKQQKVAGADSSLLA